MKFSATVIAIARVVEGSAFPSLPKMDIRYTWNEGRLPERLIAPQGVWKRLRPLYSSKATHRDIERVKCQYTVHLVSVRPTLGGSITCQERLVLALQTAWNSRAHPKHATRGSVSNYEGALLKTSYPPLASGVLLGWGTRGIKICVGAVLRTFGCFRVGLAVNGPHPSPTFLTQDLSWNYCGYFTLN